jgi:uncharacterized protein (TIGR02118 family)
LITRFGLAPRKPGLTTAEFQSHWHRQHGALAAQIKGVQRYWQNHAVLHEGEPLLPWPGFDACADIDFADLATMQSGFAAATYTQQVRSDEKKLVEKEKGGLVITRRLLQQGSIDPGRIRLLTFMRLAPEKDLEALCAGLTSLPMAPTAAGRELFLAVDAREIGLAANLFDAVEAQWFEDPTAAQRHLNSAPAREQRHGITELLRGVERLIARVHVIV